MVCIKPSLVHGPVRPWPRMGALSSLGADPEPEKESSFLRSLWSGVLSPGKENASFGHGALLHLGMNSPGCAWLRAAGWAGVSQVSVSVLQPPLGCCSVALRDTALPGPQRPEQRVEAWLACGFSSSCSVPSSPGLFTWNPRAREGRPGGGCTCQHCSLGFQLWVLIQAPRSVLI